MCLTPNHLSHLSTANKQKHPQVHILMARLLFSGEYKSSALYKVQQMLLAAKEVASHNGLHWKRK